MKRWFWLMGVGILISVVGCGGAGGPQGLLLHFVLDGEGRTVPEVVVRNAQGEELRRVEVEGRVVGLSPLAGGYRASVRTLDGQHYVVDASQGTAMEIEPQGEETHAGQVETGQVAGGGKRWAILDWSEGDIGYLIDLETGELYDLQGIAPDAMLQWAVFSADESHLLVTDMRWTWILPTDDPEEVRQLGEVGTSSYGARFSADGSQVLYVLRTDGGETELHLERVDGSKTEVLLEDDDLRQAWFVRGRDELLVMYKESLTVFSPRSGDEQEILDLDGPSIATPYSGSDGMVLLHVLENYEEHQWFSVDTKSGRARRLRELDDRLDAAPSPWLPQTELVVVADGPVFSMDPVTIAFSAVEVASGETQKELELEGVRQWMVVSGSDQGEHLLLQVRLENEYQLWLFSAGSDGPVKIAEGDYVTGAVSPDKRWIAVSVEERSGGDRDADLELYEIRRGKTIDLGEGAYPIWARP